jgi:hypothetical protein
VSEHLRECARTDEAPAVSVSYPAWLGQIAALSGTEALALLGEKARSVPADFCSRVEAEYNAGVKAARCPKLTPLTPGILAQDTARVWPATSSFGAATAILPAPPTCIGAPTGRFYYIAAGVGLWPMLISTPRQVPPQPPRTRN